MSSGNCTTEYTRLERAADDKVIRDAALTRNSVLRRALQIAAREYLKLDGGDHPRNADAALMITWVMEASEENTCQD